MSDTNEPRPLRSVRWVARRLNMSEEVVARKARRLELRATKVFGKWGFEEADIEQLIEEGYHV